MFQNTIPSYVGRLLERVQDVTEVLKLGLEGVVGTVGRMEFGSECVGVGSEACEGFGVMAGECCVADGAVSEAANVFMKC